MHRTSYFYVPAVITGIILGVWFMYLIDATWIFNKVERRKAELDTKMTRYTDAIDVSHQMVNNCYDAFYIVSKCSTKDECDFLEIAVKLRVLNREREKLKERFDSIEVELNH